MCKPIYINKIYKIFENIFYMRFKIRVMSYYDVTLV